MMLLQGPPKKDKKEGENDDQQEEEAKQEEEEEPPCHLNVIWDEMEIDNGDVLEEACVGNEYNLSIKGAPKANDSPSTSKMVAKKTTPTVISPKKSLKKDKDNWKDSTAIKSTLNVDLTQKILGDLKLDFDVVEDLRKMKENIIVFELCKITQLRQQLHETLQHIQVPQDVLVGNVKVTLKGKNAKVTKLTKASSVASTSSIDNKAKKTGDQNKGDPRADGALIDKKSQSSYPTISLDLLNIQS